MILRNGRPLAHPCHSSRLHPTFYRTRQPPHSTRPQYPVFAVGEKVANHLFSLQNVEILAFRPLRGTPSSGHGSTAVGKVFDRSYKVGVVRSGAVCCCGLHLAGVCSERARFCALRSSAVPELDRFLSKPPLYLESEGVHK